MGLAGKIGKTAVVSGVCDGFIGNRMVDRYFKAANELVLSGALPWQIDQALEHWGMAMGPFRMSDMAGNDITWAVNKRRSQGKAPPPPEVLDALCEKGRFGQRQVRDGTATKPAIAKRSRSRSRAAHRARSSSAKCHTALGDD